MIKLRADALANGLPRLSCALLAFQLQENITILCL
jgi:hypothetical protein